jgi:hypothetical protein
LGERRKKFPNVFTEDNINQIETWQSHHKRKGLPTNVFYKYRSQHIQCNIKSERLVNANGFNVCLCVCVCAHACMWGV